MKVANTMLSSVLLLLVTCQGSFAHAHSHAEKNHLPVYQNVISDISLGYEDAMLAGTVVVNDGEEVMRVLDYKVRDDNAMKTWKKGDVISFDAHIKDDGLVLTAKRLTTPNPDEVKPYMIVDVFESPKSGLKITEINENGEYIKLSDDSVWKFGWYSGLSTKVWKVGQRVLVDGQGDKNSYTFINLDVPCSKNASTATATFVAH